MHAGRAAEDGTDADLYSSLCQKTSNLTFSVLLCAHRVISDFAEIHKALSSNTTHFQQRRHPGWQIYRHPLRSCKSLRTERYQAQSKIPSLEAANRTFSQILSYRLRSRQVFKKWDILFDLFEEVIMLQVWETLSSCEMLTSKDFSIV